MTNKQLRTGKDGYIRIVVGQSPYKSADKRYNQEDYLFTRPAFIVSDKKAENIQDLKTMAIVLGMIFGKEKAKEYIINYKSIGAAELVNDLTRNGIYLANIEDDKEKIQDLVACGNKKDKLLLLGSDAIDAVKNFPKKDNVEIYEFPHPSRHNLPAIFKAFIPDGLFEIRDYSSSDSIKKGFTIQ